MVDCSGSASISDDFEPQDGKPCICNSTFYRHCPKNSQCFEDIILDPLPSSDEQFMNSNLPRGYHDDSHPDHVDMIPNFNRYRTGPRYMSRPSWNDGETILRRRKVYVTPREQEKQPPVHAFTIRIPIVAPTVPSISIPDPPPIFKFKKYITYESKPEVQMVPVTRTIIKPVGVTPDQIINADDSILRRT